MSTVLVTGAGGYIGTALVPMLLKAGYAVHAVDRFFFGRELLAERPGRRTPYFSLSAPSPQETTPTKIGPFWVCDTSGRDRGPKALLGLLPLRASSDRSSI